MSSELDAFGSSTEDNHDDEDSSANVKHRTNIELQNPRHPDASVTYADGQDQYDYFDAAEAATNWPEVDRRAYVGMTLLHMKEIMDTLDTGSAKKPALMTDAFYSAVQTYLDDGDSSELAQVVENITGSSVTIEDDSDD